VTGTAPHSPEPDETWTAARHRDLLNGLSQHLDPDAGLHDIMLHADHAGLAGTLGRHLDIQAGLNAILTTSPAPAPREAQGQAEATAAIKAADPAARMALRRSPIARAVILGDLIARTLTNTSQADDRILDRDLDRALNGHAEALHRAAETVGANRAHILVGVLRDILGRLINGGLYYAIARDLDLALRRDLESALRRDLDLALDLAREVDRDLDLDLARRLVQETARIMCRALGIRLVEGLAAALLEGALDDFTQADLTRTSLAGRDLAGVRWSDWGTMWPPGTDTGELRARSREITPGTGIYKIMRPGHEDKGRRYANV
jgi:hypothetical protein